MRNFELVEPQDESTTLQMRFFQYGFQYYMAGRCAAAANANPVAANLIHHALEMFLKGELCRHADENQRKRLSHNLVRVWKEFKALHKTAADIDRFDTTIDDLHKYENVRYPEQLLKTGMRSSFQFGEQTQKTTPTSDDSYHLSMGEIDALVLRIFQLASWNPRAFTVLFQEPGWTYLRYKNVAPDLFRDADNPAQGTA